jgi:uncharacterized protein YcbK (DUF882 family)
MKYFTLQELWKSATATRKGINNQPNGEVSRRLRDLVTFILDPLREAWQAPIIVTSAYRCPKLNQAVGGSRTSQHVLGMAADIRTVSDSRDDNKRLFELIRKLQLPFDQLINEYNYDWIHVSYGPRHRRQILDATKWNGSTRYTVHT